MKIKYLIRFALICFMLTPMMLMAQNATLKGSVKDAETQDASASAAINLNNPGFRANVLSNPDGTFEFKDVPYGKYTLTIDLDGFNQTILSVEVNQPVVEVSVVNMVHIDLGDDNIPTVSLGDDQVKETTNANVSGVLTSTRDPFESASMFTFSAARFRPRGYNYEDQTFMNGLLMEDLVNSRGLYSAWSGLNDVVRSRESTYGLNPSTYGYGGLNGSNNIDAKASRQRKQLQVSYALSNRTYDNRLMATYGTGLMKGGWSFAASISRRWADEGYVQGTFYNGISWFASIEKRFGTNHSISLTQFGANTVNARATAAIQEVYDLAGSNYYNPSWGFQNGEKRSANIGRQASPLTILAHEWKIDSKSDLKTSVGYQFGSYSVTGLDWFNAPDPRPDFYRRLPSYIDDPTMAAQAAYLWQTDESYRQIDWENLYAVNMNNYETIDSANGIAGNSVYGKRSRYIVSERVQDTKRYSLSSTYNSTINDNLIVTAGLNIQHQETEYYRRVNDLLGGDFYVDLNQFAELAYPDSFQVLQNNLDVPNRILQVGDKYGYNYKATVNRKGFWIQPQFKFNRVDGFVGIQVMNTSYFRTGYYRSGVFQDNSLGESTQETFNNYGIKAGATYKINGRNYIFLNASNETRAPLFEDVFISPRTRDLTNPNATNEKIMSIEAGYLLRAPKTKIRATAYYTQMNDGINNLTFFHEDYRTLVNYSLSNMDRRHVGVEIGADHNLGQGFSASTAIAIGQYFYTDRMNAIITADNTSQLLAENETIYSKNFYVAGGPQSAYTLGLRYRAKKFWNAYLNLNYFDKIWYDFNPARRTVTGVAPYSEGAIREAIIDQLQASGQFTMDISFGKSWKLNNYFPSMKKQTFFLINIGVNNVLNNTNIITNGYEQLRFDFAEKDINKFAPKAYYGFGTNYFVNFTLRFN
ncbi:MAG: carboxypeptidase regulatory-like domain-containing protein [Bacteroidota bacterium]|jgi:hypothetical protein